MMYIVFALLLSIQVALGSFGHNKHRHHHVRQTTNTANVTTGGFVNPTSQNGSLLTSISGGPDGPGEPLNVIILGNLSDSQFVNYGTAIGFAPECLGLHFGSPQVANLGDGNHWVNQAMVLRGDYGNSSFGSCYESLYGGNHLRMWRQNGTAANTSALFLAVSVEKSIKEYHAIVPNGYDLGRDQFVNAALGLKSSENATYQTVLVNRTGLISPGSSGVNHDIATDGNVAILNVAIVTFYF